jgi:hypothetical protein
MNEKGLVVVSAAASNMERDGHATAVGRMLTRASSVREAIEMVRRGRVHGPIHYIVGDRSEIALIEVINGNRYEVLIKKDGTVFHTNHFILNEMTNLNPRVKPSSLARMERIDALLSEGPFDTEAFIAFTRDHANGPGDHSICRHSKERGRSSERTLSAIVFFLPGEGSPKVWTSLDQPCQSTFTKQ